MQTPNSFLMQTLTHPWLLSLSCCPSPKPVVIIHIVLGRFETNAEPKTALMLYI